MNLFTGTELKYIGIVVGAVTLIALVLTISIGLAKRPKNISPPVQSAGGAVELPYISEIIIPAEFTLTGGEGWYFSREPLKKWSENQVNLYWIDPAEIGIDLMKAESDKAVGEFMAKVP